MVDVLKNMNPLDYPLISLPFAFKPLKEMSEEEAEQHLKWFVSKSKTRQGVLLDAVERLSGNKNEIDYTPQSLIPLWRGVSALFKIRAMTEEERRKFYRKVPEAAKKIKFSLSTYTTETLCLAVDIGYYVAEIYMRHYPQVHWIVYPTKSMSFNKPALFGFYLPLVPSDMVKGSIGKHLKTPMETHLFNIYEKWVTNLV